MPNMPEGIKCNGCIISFPGLEIQNILHQKKRILQTKLPCLFYHSFRYVYSGNVKPPP